MQTPHRKAPSRWESNPGPANYVTGVWTSTKVRLKSNSLTMLYQCPEIDMSTALCWKHGSYCTVVFELHILKQEYNTSAVDKHPQMCVQNSSYNDNTDLACVFSDMSSWMVHVDLRRQSILVYINSSVPAKFSAQLCKLSQTTCASIGDIQSLNTVRNSVLLTLNYSITQLHSRKSKVWQSEPALHGKRILCPEYSRGRYGIYALAILVCGIIVITLGIFFYHMIKKDTAGWFNIQRPVLLVCSSEDSVHISTVCTLASILQGDLGATVHLALWAQSTRSHYGMGVTDVGPLPWLYGQWDSVIKAHGNVLIIWSLDAIIAYKEWWSEKECVKSSNQKDCISHISHKMEETATLIGKYRVKKEHAAQRTVVTEPCTVIAPVFKAALTCLMGALQEKNLQQVAFVCLHGHNTRKDIPKSLRAFPCYCLPRQFSELMQELGVKSRLSEKSRFHCWTGLLSKVLCFWVGQQLSITTEKCYIPSGGTHESLRGSRVT
uniref:SEFIR domain-containing protein n=1 Tax=Neogobius melanostomus TaxID=47308 RepID=A0A8C6TKP8_9GOBI